MPNDDEDQPKTLRDYLFNEDLDFGASLPPGVLEQLGEISTAAAANMQLRDTLGPAIEMARQAAAASLDRNIDLSDVLNRAATSLKPAMDQLQAAVAMFSGEGTLGAAAAGPAMAVLRGEGTLAASGISSISLSTLITAEGVVDATVTPAAPSGAGERTPITGPHSLSVGQVLALFFAAWYVVQQHLAQDGQTHPVETDALAAAIVALLWALSNLIP